MAHPFNNNRLPPSGFPAHGCRAKRISTNFSVGNNVLTAVQWDGEDYDTDSIHDTVLNTTRMTIPVIPGVTTGLWAISSAGYADVINAPTDCDFRLNGTTVIAMTRVNGTTSIGPFVCNTQYVFTAGDYVEARVRCTGGTGSVIYDSLAPPHFAIAFLGLVT